ncbi:MAG: DUF805 domain-containing protein [Lentisphaerae bacterium]|nr:DUF805 domain-containing protein [Lentisphaerota bacterium]
MNHIETCFKKYWDFSGRASRSEFWSFWLFCIVINIIIGLAGLFVDLLLTSDKNPLVPGSGISWPGIVFYLLVFMPQLAVVSRRLHDLDRGAVDFSLYMIFLWLPATFLDSVFCIMPWGNFISDLIGDENMVAVVFICFLLCFVSGLIFLINFCRRGTVGDNCFGKDPLAE